MKHLLIIVIILMSVNYTYSQEKMTVMLDTNYKAITDYLKIELKIKDSILCNNILMYKNIYPLEVECKGFDALTNITNCKDEIDIFYIDSTKTKDKSHRIVGKLFDVIAKEYIKKMGIPALIQQVYGSYSAGAIAIEKSNMKIYFERKVPIDDNFDTYLLSLYKSENNFGRPYNRELLLVNIKENKLLSFVIFSKYIFYGRYDLFVYTQYLNNKTFCQFNYDDFSFYCLPDDLPYENYIRYVEFRISEQGLIEIVK